ncbi:hypothetical protein KS4_10120 [Poriferisphaera corsica]|uniref:UPF0235 protein KS4_10120 n=1 Tax=Poriferisphaera corsica TaxID=2528020 RepID=A0A517YRY0_9BACT|nr:DUF167 domain-containing protein [Poriferisphaera corsica]QDU32973.1 hypothetical protein KS4_10120 [Poriferisphaera corsica]
MTESPHIITQPDDTTLLVRIKVVPNASRTKIVGRLGDRIKIAVAAPPEAGKANKQIIALLAKTLKLPKKQIEIDTGHTQPQKTIRINTLTPATAHDLLKSHLKTK